MTGNPETTVTSLAQEAFELQQAGRLEEAEARYREAVEAESDDPDMWHHYGILAFQRRQLDEAGQRIERALQLNDLPHYHNTLGLVYQAQGKMEQAYQQYEAAVLMDPALAEAHHNLGKALGRDGRIDEAIESLRRAVQSKPDYVNAHLELGNLMFTTGRLDDAIASFKQALVCQPNFAEAHNNLGCAFQKSRQYDLAIQHYRQAIALKPGYPDAYNNLGTALCDQNRDVEAIDALRQAIALKPDYAEAYLHLGKALLKLDRLDEAMDAYDRVVQLRPDSGEAHFGRGNVYFQQKRPDEAEACYTKSLQLNPNLLQAHYNLGCVYQEQNRTEEAKAHYNKALELNPEYAEVYNNIGNLHFVAEAYDEAMVAFKTAIRLRRNYADAFNNLGLLYYRLNQLDNALMAFRLAVRHQPDHAEALNNMGAVYQAQDKLDESLACIKKAISLKPRKLSYLCNLGNVYQTLGLAYNCLAAYRQAYAVEPVLSLEIAMNNVMPSIYQSVEEIGQWRERHAQNLQRLRQEELKLRNPMKDIPVSHFYLAYHGLNDRDINRGMGEMYAGANIWRKHISKPNDKPRIGFISRHLYNSHTIGKLNMGLIDKLSREQFDVSVFSIGVPKNFQLQSPHQHVVLPSKSMDRYCDEIMARNLDVLFYTDIGMDTHTYFMAFNRLARVQCVTWGHPVTTGIPEMDYFVSSRLLETENSENHYTEHLVQLETLPTYYYRPSLQLTGVTRETFGFNDNQHLYLCPQMLFKFHPDFDLILADILRRDPQGVLVLVNAGHAVWAEMLLRRFHQNMPDVVDRIRILDRLKTQHFLALIDNVDVVLDTLHFGGGSSTYDTLALGTPVVTLPGEFMRGRVTYGCYRKMSILDCVAQSPEEYVEKALHLGTDADYRRDMKERLRQASHVLYEDQAAVNALEAFLLWALNADQQ